MKLTLESLRNSALHIHIVGAAAVEGSVIARFLHSLGVKNVVLHDFCEKKDFPKRFLAFHNGVEKRMELWQTMRTLPYPIHFQESYLDGIENADLIFLNQAWYRYDCNLPRLATIVDAGGIAISSMTDLALQLFPGTSIGVTGTHGKTTVTRLISHILRAVHKAVFTSGNDRHSEQILDQIADGNVDASAFLVLEISNRQLKMTLERSPTIAVITNIYPNHLDEHFGMDDYRATKMRIAEHQTAGDVLVVGDNDCALVSWAEQHKGQVIGDGQVSFIKQHFHVSQNLAGDHNVVNVALVYEVMKTLGLDDEEFQAALATFPGVEKRQECILQSDAVRVINDSISTTPTATMMAVKTFQHDPLVLILGGDNKNIPQASWDALVAAVSAVGQCLVLVLPGTIREPLQHTNWLQVETLADALVRAQQFVEQQKSLTTVLISPSGEAFYTMFLAGQSLDQLAKNYFSSSTAFNRG